MLMLLAAGLNLLAVFVSWFSKGVFSDMNAFVCVVCLLLALIESEVTKR